MFTDYDFWLNMFPLMLTSHLALSRASKLSPDAPTMCGMLALSICCILRVLYIKSNMMLFMALVSNRVLIFSPILPFGTTGKTVPEVDLNSFTS